MRLARAVVAVAVVGSVVLAARLTQGPIDLALFKPTIEAALSDAFGGADIGAGRVILRAGQGRLAIVAFGVRAADADGETVARASRIEIGLDATALLRGEVRPRQLDLLNARLIATRDADGGMRLLASAPEENAGDAEPSMDVVNLLREWLSGARVIGDLPEIRLRSATLIAVDGATEETLWEGAVDAGVTLSPDRALLWAEIGLDPATAAAPVRLSATLARAEGGDAALTFADADLAILARVARLFGADAPDVAGDVAGNARIAVDRNLAPLRASLSLSGDGVVATRPDGRRLAFDAIALEAQADILDQTLLVSGLRLGPNGAGLVGAGSLKPDGSTGGYVVAGRIDHADLGYLAELLGRDAEVAGMKAALTVDFDLELGDDGVRTAEARIVADGEIDRPDMFYGPVAIERAEGFVGYRADTGALSLRGFDATVSEIQIAGEATATTNADGDLATLDAKLRTGDFPVARLAELWPKSFSVGGRAWVERNLLKGRITGADVVLAKATDSEIAVSGDFGAEDLEIRYWDPMPLATGVAGAGRFVGDTLTMNVTAGASGGLRTNDVKVELIDLGAPEEHIAIDGRIVGPAPRLLAALEREPLRYASWLGVTPSETKGAVDGRLTLKFPLIDELSVDDLAIAATGKATNAVLPRVVSGWDLTAKTMEIAVDADRLSVDGEGEMLGEPLTFAGDVRFGPGDERARFKGAWRLTRDVRGALGLGAAAVRRRLAGVMPARFDVTARADQLYEIGIDADLTPATLLAQEIGWLKPKGAPARLKALAVIDKGAPLRIDDIELTAADLSLSADVTFDRATGAVRKVAVRRLLGAGHDLAGDVGLDPGGARVRVYGRKADLRPLLQLNRPDEAPQDPPAPDTTPKRFNIDVAEARLSESLSLKRLRADFTLVDGWPTSMQAAAEYDGGELGLTPDPEGESALRLTASDFGRLLAAADVTDGIRGGTADVSIEERPEETYGLEARVKDFDFTKAEIVAIAGESASGLVSLLGGGDAVRFDRLDLFARYKDGLFIVDKGRAAGAAIGMSARGEIDFRNRAIDLTGAISPAYAISRVIGGIPILGDILTGSKKEGVFAANYRASGDLDDPTFKLDGLSALAPGILREALQPPDPNAAAPPETTPDADLQ